MQEDSVCVNQLCAFIRAEFLFRRPPLSFVDNIFTLPFSRSVWLASAGLIAVMGILLHEALNQEDSLGGQVTWSDVALLTVGAVCQQGKELFPRF